MENEKSKEKTEEMRKRKLKMFFKQEIRKGLSAESLNDEVSKIIDEIKEESNGA